MNNNNPNPYSDWDEVTMEQIFSNFDPDEAWEQIEKEYDL